MESRHGSGATTGALKQRHTGEEQKLNLLAIALLNLQYQTRLETCSRLVTDAEVPNVVHKFTCLGGRPKVA